MITDLHSHNLIYYVWMITNLYLIINKLSVFWIVYVSLRIMISTPFSITQIREKTKELHAKQDTWRDNVTVKLTSWTNQNMTFITGVSNGRVSNYFLKNRNKITYTFYIIWIIKNTKKNQIQIDFYYFYTILYYYIIIF